MKPQAYKHVYYWGFVTIWSEDLITLLDYNAAPCIHPRCFYMSICELLDFQFNIHLLIWL